MNLKIFKGLLAFQPVEYQESLLESELFWAARPWTPPAVWWLGQGEVRASLLCLRLPSYPPPHPAQLISSSHPLRILFLPLPSQLLSNPLHGSGYLTSSPSFLCIGWRWPGVVPSSPRSLVPLLGAASFMQIPETRILELPGPLVVVSILYCNCLAASLPPRPPTPPRTGAVLCLPVFYTQHRNICA